MAVAPTLGAHSQPAAVQLPGQREVAAGLEQEAELRRKIAYVNPILDSGRSVKGVTRVACEFWPSEPSLGFPHAQDVRDLPDTLRISIMGYPSTPYVAGASLADSLGGTLLTDLGGK